MTRLALLACLALALPLAACGSSIGDSCSTHTDCSQEGTRICDTTAPDGYCTVEGCSYGTCPDEAACVSFFPGLESGPACDFPTAANDCALDEVCTRAGVCAPRSIERRFCMKTCDGDGDCRDGYECRSEDVQAAHGGQPVSDPQSPDVEPPTTAFCAPARPCLGDEDCLGEPGYTCQDRYCLK